MEGMLIHPSRIDVANDLHETYVTHSILPSRKRIRSVKKKKKKFFILFLERKSLEVLLSETEGNIQIN